ncbi:MAG: helix-turn-helix domain-containing protein [Bacteroidales bacterium]|nr:helix-turn-helix domain-containing protein [Bacteroidales bacterium]
MMKMMPEDVSECEALGTRAAARFLGVCERTLYALTKAGRIRCIRFGNGPKAKKRYPKEELRRFLHEEMQ